ncbi:uncharacterized protein LOC113327554 [Papaver somniferum]|uniref:uncharacterized protein LOC113327554 n=1 Tax=Papaver somniferum TaxID=3469 RepID=UPI000E6F952F|nr:uncharacterized protein LOC113327554 [Papaver somniferum]
MDQLPSFEEIHEAVFDLGADSAPGPDGFAGFFYRHCWEIIRDDLIFTKILATRLGSVLSNLVSEEKVAFMKGRNIHDNISVASEMVNVLKIKRKDDNVGLKLDVTQAFDTGDPLSPLIFVLIEDVLTRSITKLFREGHMTTMVIRKGISPTHLFFADDMIFCKGNMKSLRNLVALLGFYQRAWGQAVSREKSKLYYGGGSLRRRATIAEFLGMNIVTFPDRYLGIKVMPGAVKYHHISDVVEKIEEQLSGWKGRMLYFQDRVVLVKSVTASYSIHNMAVYKWPGKFIHQCEVAIHNFLWSGDFQVSRSFVVAYDKICGPYE